MAWDRTTGQAVRPGHRLAGPAHGRALRRAARAAGHLPTSCASGPGWCSTRTSAGPSSSGCSPTAACRVGDDLALGTIDSWLIWNLTGGEVHATDATNASRTMLYDIRRPAVGRRAVRPARRAAAPRCPTSWRPAGGSASRPTGCGVPAGIPVSGIAGDQQAALFGQACVHPGMAKNTYGTGSFVLLNVGADVPRADRGHAHDGRLGARRRHRRLRAGRARSSPPAPPSSGCATGSASSTTRRRDRAAGGERARHRRRRTSCPPSPASARRGGTRTPGARSSGITRGTTTAHLARAVVEAMALPDPRRRRRHGRRPAARR